MDQEGKQDAAEPVAPSARYVTFDDLAAMAAATRAAAFAGVQAARERGRAAADRSVDGMVAGCGGGGADQVDAGQCYVAGQPAAADACSARAYIPATPPACSASQPGAC